MKKLFISTLRLSVFCFLYIACLVVGGVAYAQQDVSETTIETSVMLKDAIRLHKEAANGAKDVAEEANKLLKKIVKREPKNGLATAYLGSSYAIMARDASNVVNKIRYSNRGIRYLDEALELAPENFVVRYIRAVVNNSFPSMFLRSEKATEDMLTLDKLFRANPSKSRAGMMTTIYEKLIVMAPAKGPWEERLKLLDTNKGGR